MNKSIQILNTLPADAVAEIKSTLGAFASVQVSRNNKTGKISATNAIVLHNGEYDEYLGEVLAKEIFTSEEQILNYVQNFRDYPWPAYKGRKDYFKMDSDWTDVSLDAEGNVIFA